MGLIRYVLFFVMAMLVWRLVNRALNNFFGPKQPPQNTRSGQRTQKKSKDIIDDVGEYVDYEEIK